MKPWLHKIEIAIDKLIPFLLIILLFIIIGEFWFHDIIAKYRTIADGLDLFIIFVFVLDLIFKYNRIKNFPKFLRASWLDIIAIFPFFLIFRIIEGVAGVFEAGEIVTRTQKVVHVGIELEPEVGKALKEGEVIAKEISRTERFSRFLRPLTRGVRFFKLGNPNVKKETKMDLRKSKKIITKKTSELKKDIEEIPRYFKTVLFYEKPKILKHLGDKFLKDLK